MAEETTEEGVGENTEVIEIDPVEKTDEEPVKVAVIGDNTNAELIKEAMKGKSIDVVDAPKEATMVYETDEVKPKKKKDIILPPIGTKFMVAGDSYKVTWLNPGKNRFSAEPCDGQY